MFSVFYKQLLSKNKKPPTSLSEVCFWFLKIFLPSNTRRSAQEIIGRAVYSALVVAGFESVIGLVAPRGGFVVYAHVFAGVVGHCILNSILPGLNALYASG
jgi:hypothetical protein